MNTQKLQTAIKTRDELKLKYEVLDKSIGEIQLKVSAARKVKFESQQALLKAILTDRFGDLDNEENSIGLRPGYVKPDSRHYNSWGLNKLVTWRPQTESIDVFLQGLSFQSESSYPYDTNMTQEEISYFVNAHKFAMEICTWAYENLDFLVTAMKTVDVEEDTTALQMALVALRSQLRETRDGIYKAGRECTVEQLKIGVKYEDANYNYIDGYGIKEFQITREMPKTYEVQFITSWGDVKTKKISKFKLEAKDLTHKRYNDFVSGLNLLEYEKKPQVK